MKIDFVPARPAPLTLLAALAVAWVVAFALIYSLVPESLALHDASGHAVLGFGNALYFSIVTAATLGDGQIAAFGWLRAVVAVEVIGGIAFAGLAVNSLVSSPSRHLRRAAKVTGGWWVERAAVHTRQPFFNFAYMGLSEGVLTKRGTNFDLGGTMHNTTYQFVLITDAFPTLLFMYENDATSVEFTEGIVRFTLLSNSKGKYLEYEGSCYDKLGRHNQLVARKVLDKSAIKKLDDGTMTEAEMQQLIAQMFPV